MRIDSFWGKYRFLSNFYPALVWFEGNLYPSVEHAYQAAKSPFEETRELIRTLPTPGKAKKMGREIQFRKGWDDLRVGVMETILRSKFDEVDLQTMLLSTGDAELVEQNGWGDVFWGMCGEEGENNLGKLLMKIRKELLRSSETQ
jgi:ribA/ribD-fused uncharacterized protein